MIEVNFWIIGQFLFFLKKIIKSSQVDETKIIFKNKLQLTEVFFQDAQKWLENQDQYNIKEKREKTEELSINNWNKKGNVAILRDNWKELEGHLNLNDFINLKKLDCSNVNLKGLDYSSNKLISLNLTSCEQLEKINCYDNQK